MSSAPDRATWQISRPVAGSSLLKVRPSAAATSLPPTRFGTTSGMRDRSIDRLTTP